MNFVLIALGILVLILIFSSIRIVNEYQRLVIFRLGRSRGTKGPGFILLIPFFDRAVRVDLREQVREVPHQVSITKDNAPIFPVVLQGYRSHHECDRCG